MQPPIGVYQRGRSGATKSQHQARTGALARRLTIGHVAFLSIVNQETSIFNTFGLERGGARSRARARHPRVQACKPTHAPPTRASRGAAAAAEAAEGRVRTTRDDVLWPRRRPAARRSARDARGAAEGPPPAPPPRGRVRRRAGERLANNPKNARRDARRVCCKRWRRGRRVELRGAQVRRVGCFDRCEMGAAGRLRQADGWPGVARRVHRGHENDFDALARTVTLVRVVLPRRRRPTDLELVSQAADSKYLGCGWRCAYRCRAPMPECPCA